MSDRPSNEREPCCAEAGCEFFVELCSGHALGALTEGDEARLLGHVERCPSCADELERAREAVVAIAASLSRLAPPPAVRGRVLDAIRASAANPAKDARSTPAGVPGRQPWREWGDTPSDQTMFYLASEQGVWEPTGVDGIEVRRLFVDQENDRMTAMFRMAPGTSYTPHVHAGYEECYVLQGDLRVGDVVMKAGDFQRAEVGSRHPLQSTVGGCLLLISSSLHDDLVD